MLPQLAMATDMHKNDYTTCTIVHVHVHVFNFYKEITISLTGGH